MSRNIRVWPFVDYDGWGVSGKCTHEEAYEAIKAEMRDNDDGGIADTLKLEDVKLSVLYKHRKCDVGTVGDTDCYDCGEAHTSAGRPVYVWHRP